MKWEIVLFFSTNQINKHHPMLHIFVISAASLLNLSRNPQIYFKRNRFITKIHFIVCPNNGRQDILTSILKVGYLRKFKRLLKRLHIFVVSVPPPSLSKLVHIFINQYHVFMCHGTHTQIQHMGGWCQEGVVNYAMINT